MRGVTPTRYIVQFPKLAQWRFKNVLRKASLMWLLLLAAPAIAEPTKIVMKVGEKQTYTFKNVGDDPKLLNKNNDIFASRDFDDPKLVTVWIIPSKPGTMYFGVTSHKDNKTLVDDILIEVTGTPVPVDPVIPNKYKDRLSVVYMVSPDKPNKDALITHLENLNKTKYNTKEDALTALRNHKITGLQSTRTEIAKILSEQTFTSDSFQSTITEVVAALRFLP